MVTTKFTSEDIWQMLAEVKDPEIPLVTIVGMGIVRDVVITSENIEVIITPTYSGCPASKEIRDGIDQKLRENSIENFVINSVLSPPWTSDWIDEETKQKLKESGIAPPHKVPTNELLSLFGDDRIVHCPYCESKKTKKTSEFGSTLCKSLHFCDGCHQPFEHFKCI
ncbi:1,2-phenylacetyl-CoA epoxidase subunit PaaD [Candidatus Uabimicrobium sp. HlEnr_7]|uniref:1,2-phenylacetyl-CoA epoxidase subunit PaaD n=1 Tax=Candidatus Uabimicrobium helgolandensis TaxID=3095367 RepID=UPI00355670C2